MSIQPVGQTQSITSYRAVDFLTEPQPAQEALRAQAADKKKQPPPPEQQTPPQVVNQQTRPQGPIAGAIVDVRV